MRHNRYAYIPDEGILAYKAKGIRLKDIPDKIQIKKGRLWGLDPEFQLEDANGRQVNAYHLPALEKFKYLDGAQATGEWRMNKPYDIKKTIKYTSDFIISFLKKYYDEGYNIITGTGKFQLGVGGHIHFLMPPMMFTNNNSRGYIPLIDKGMDKLAGAFYAMGGITSQREDNGYGMSRNGDSRFNSFGTYEYRRLPSYLSNPVMMGLAFYYADIIKEMVIDAAINKSEIKKIKFDFHKIVEQALDNFLMDFPMLSKEILRWRVIFRKENYAKIKVAYLDEKGLRLWEKIGEKYNIEQNMTKSAISLSYFSGDNSQKVNIAKMMREISGGYQFSVITMHSGRKFPIARINDNLFVFTGSWERLPQDFYPEVSKVIGYSGYNLHNYSVCIPNTYTQEAEFIIKTFVNTITDVIEEENNLKNWEAR